MGLDIEIRCLFFLSHQVKSATASKIIVALSGKMCMIIRFCDLSHVFTGTAKKLFGKLK